MPTSPVTVAFGVKRVHLQSWIDVIQQADLVLRRVDCCLTLALAGLAAFHPSLLGVPLLIGLLSIAGVGIGILWPTLEPRRYLRRLSGRSSGPATQLA